MNVLLVGIWDCLCVDLVSEAEKLPQVDMLIANLLIEYIGYECFKKVVTVTKPVYVSCIIRVNGDDSSKDYQDWADRNNADEVIVLLSSFDVDSSGGDGSLNPNSTYNDWKWILVRTNGGQWQHVDHGY